MEYAHQGIELKPLPGIPVPPPRQQLVAEAKAKGGETPLPRPTMLSKRGADVLVRVEQMMDDATRALGPLPTVSSTGEKQAATRRQTDALASSLEGKDFNLGDRN